MSTRKISCMTGYWKCHHGASCPSSGKNRSALPECVQMTMRQQMKLNQAIFWWNLGSGI